MRLNKASEDNSYVHESVLIDADRIPYMLGNAMNDKETDYLDWPLVAARVDSVIQNTLLACNGESINCELYLTDSDSNFRLQYAKILPYKGTRPVEKPHYFHRIREYLLDEWAAILAVGIEADDQMGIDQTEYTIISSVDKDMNMIPGYHHNPITDKIYHISKIQGLRNFYKQLLTGDRVDNVSGLYGIGEKSVYLKNIDGLTSELDMYSLVKSMYIKYFGAYWYIFMVENAILLWILREPPTDVPYIVTRFKQLEEELK